jgi:uncharacterized protein YndB with AHSA1/START domain
VAARASNKSGVANLEREVEITRIIDAPPAIVFEAWTDPEHMAQWWGPAGFTNPVCELDVRPGGAIFILMRAPDGAEHPMTGTFHEIVPPERLVFTACAVDHQGKRLLEAHTTVTFVEQGGMTRLTVEARAVGLVDLAARMLEGMEAGWTQSLERLAQLAATRSWNGR